MTFTAKWHPWQNDFHGKMAFAAMLSMTNALYGDGFHGGDLYGDDPHGGPPCETVVRCT